MLDKSKVLNTSINLINDKLHFRGITDGNDPISIDYTPPLGDNLGYTSLELLLLSLSSCLGSAILVFLRRMTKNITGFVINSTGVRRDEHPTGFKTITLDIQLKSSNTTAEELSKVIKMSEDTYCPVFAMIRGNVEIVIHQNISTE